MKRSYIASLVLLLATVGTDTFVSGGCTEEVPTKKISLPAIPRVRDLPNLTLRIEDPDGGFLFCKRELRSTASTSWQGACMGGGPANFLQLSAGDDSGVLQMFGSYEKGGKVCNVLPDAKGKSKVRCVKSDFGADISPEEDGDIPDFLDDEDELMESGNRRLFSMEHSMSSLNHRRLYDDSGSTIDIMIVWTKKAECLNSGLPEGCTFTKQTSLNMMGLSFLAVAETNAAFALSNVSTRLRMVHAYRTPDYEEPTDERAFRTILRDLARRSDIEMVDVHEQRDLYGADVVHMIVGAPGACGRAFLGPNIRSAFSISNFVCTSGLFSMGHEIAHSFGAQHDRASLGFPPDLPLMDYNFGYRDAVLGYRTMMAYPCEVGQVDTADQPSSCPRLQRFSNNITLTDDGFKLGDEFHNVARTINEASAEIASYFPAMDCISDEQCDDQVNSTIDICDPFRRVCIFEENLSETEPSKTSAESGCYTSYLQDFYLSFWKVVYSAQDLLGFR